MRNKRISPLWQCHRPLPLLLWGQQAEQLCVADWMGLGLLWWWSGSVVEWVKGCHTPSLLWPVMEADRNVLLEDALTLVPFHTEWTRFWDTGTLKMPNYTYILWIRINHDSTCMAWTSLLLSSRAADAVEVPKDAAPLWRPRIMRPSFLYCSMGSQNRSLTPWTGRKAETQRREK